MAVAIWAGVAAGALALAATPAAAHALAQSSDPAAGARLGKAPATVTIIFGEAPDPRLSLIRVLDSSGTNRTAGRTLAVPGNPEALQVHLGSLADGVYTVAWRTVSKVDGHLATGTFAFGVGVTPSGARLSGSFSSKSPTPSSTGVAGRWLFYAGVMVLVGGAAVALACYADVPRRIAAVLSGGWVVAVAGTLVITVDARAKAGLAWGDLLGSSLGHELEWRAIPIVVAAVLLAAASRAAGTPRRALVALVGVGGLAAMWGDVEASHAAAAHSLRLLRMADQWAHFAAAGIWVGGLVAILATITTVPPDQRRRAASRYSFTALAAVAVVGATGLQRAYDEIGSWHRLFHTGFGQSVAVKVVLLAVLIVLGAVNRYRSVRRVDTTARPLRAVGLGEIAVVAVVLVATGIIQSLAPPSSVAAPTRPLVLNGSDFGTTVRVRLTISPGMVGFNTFTVSATDYDTAAPVAGSVSLDFVLPARPDVGSSTLNLRPVKAGVFTGDGPNLSLAGKWSVTATIQKSTGGVQIPFTVAPRTPPEKIIVQRGGPGLPTTYTLQLPGGQSVQTYLDPDRPGFNEFHVTFLASGGQEQPMDALTVRATRPGQTATAALTVRRLDPLGHFVADLPAAGKGPYGFEISGTATTGAAIAGTFTITLG